MTIEGQLPACAENCSVLRAKDSVVVARAKAGEIVTRLAKSSVIADGDGMLEVLESELTLGDITSEAATGLAGIAIRTCPLAREEKMGLKRRVFPTGCGSPIVTRGSINDMATYAARVERSASLIDETLEELRRKQT